MILGLLDIKVKEQSEENLLRGRAIYEPPRFMSVNTAVEQLLESEATYGKKICTEDSLAIGVARVGTETQQVVCGTLAQLRTYEFGEPLHSLVMVGKTHLIEDEFLEHFRIKSDQAAAPAVQE